MPRPIVQIFQEYQNAVVSPIEPTFKTVVVGINRHIQDYPEDKTNIRAVDASDKYVNYGELVEALLSASTPSPTQSAATIPAAPNNIAGAVVEDASVDVFADEAWAEMDSGTDGVVTYQGNDFDTTAGDFSKIQVGDRIIMTPTAVQIFEDLNQDFSGVVPGTDYLKISTDIHEILKVHSKHRLLVAKAIVAPATKGLFTAADGTPNVAYTIGDNAATYDNEIGAGTTGQRITWKTVKVFQDLEEDFVTNGVTTSHYLKIASETFAIYQVIDGQNLLITSEFAAADASATTAYSIGTASGLYKDIIDHSLTNTNGQRLASDSVVGRVYEVKTATKVVLNQYVPFHSDTGVLVKYRLEHNLLDSEKPAGTDGWELSSSVAPTTKVITVAAGNTVTYLGSTRKVHAAKLYVAYTAIRTDTAANIFEVSSDSIDSLLGQDDTRNPLRRAAGIAIANAGAARIYVLALATDDTTGHTTAQQICANDKQVYCICILNTTSAIITSWKTHVETLSTAAKGKRRILVAQGGSLPDTKELEDQTDGQKEGTTVLFSPAADFISAGVAPGDKIVITKANGVTISPASEYVVDSIVSGNRLQSVTTITETHGVSGDIEFTVERDLDKNGQVTELSATPQAINSSRVYLVWPDTVVIGSDTTESGAYVGAAVAGMVAALPSQKPLTNVSIAGIDELKNSNTYFSDEQLDDLIDAGWFVYQQDTPASAPYALQQYSTKGSAGSVGEKYLSSVKNFDYVANSYQLVLDEFPGEWNVIPELFTALEETIRATSDTLIAKKVPKIGAPLLEISDLRIEPSATLSDKVEMWMKVRLPNVLNDLDLHLISV